MSIYIHSHWSSTIGLNHSSADHKRIYTDWSPIVGSMGMRMESILMIHNGIDLNPTFVRNRRIDVDIHIGMYLD